MKPASILVPALLALAAPAPGSPSPASASSPDSPAYTLHEWGTFTTVSGSDGALLTGLEREEELLPWWVHSHEGMRNGSLGSKGWYRPLANVTVKMETPVIYFYTDSPFKAHVEVGFRGGAISQWFPDRSGGESPPAIKRDPRGNPLGVENTFDFARGHDGRIEWKVDVTPAPDDIYGRVFKPGETLNWLHPRQTDSALVTNAKGQAEKYLFYRGVGRFDLPVTFSSDTDGTIHIRNNSDDSIPGLIVFNNTGTNSVGFTTLGPVGPKGRIEVKPSSLAPTQGDWRPRVYEAVAAMLTSQGLFRKEADAMIQTWWNSYFEHDGLRVFWALPESLTGKILPLNVTPAPARQVRVLVGRSEIMTPAFEDRLLADFRNASNERPNPWTGNRYFLAYSSRVNQLTQAAAKVAPAPSEKPAPAIKSAGQSATRRAVERAAKAAPPPIRGASVTPTAQGPAPAAQGDRDIAFGTAGVTPLMRAAEAGDIVVVEELIAGGADVHARTGAANPSGARVGGLTALMFAAGNRHADVVRLLLAHGTRVDEKSANGQTALSRATLTGRSAPSIDTIRVLLEAGARPDAARPKNTPLVDLAERNGHTEVAALLRRYQ